MYHPGGIARLLYTPLLIIFGLLYLAGFILTIAMLFGYKW